MVAVPTAGRGIGLIVAKEFRRRGLAVVVGDLNTDAEGWNVVEELGGPSNAAYLRTDVTDFDALQDIFLFTRRRFGRVDVVVANAGIDDPNRITAVIAEDGAGRLAPLDHLVTRVNFIHPIEMLYLAVHHFRQNAPFTGGQFIATASIAGLYPASAKQLYTASKHGCIGLVRSAGNNAHLRREGISANAVCPGLVYTDLVESMRKANPAAFTTLYDKPTPPDIVASAYGLFLDRPELSGEALIASELELHFVASPKPVDAVSAIIAGAVGTDTMHSTCE